MRMTCNNQIFHVVAENYKNSELVVNNYYLYMIVYIYTNIEDGLYTYIFAFSNYNEANIG